MNPIHILINDTLALDEKATAGPWTTDSKDRYGLNYSGPITVKAGDKYMAYHSDTSTFLLHENAALIAAYRSSAPTLARIAKIAVEALENAPHAVGCLNRSSKGNGPCTCWKSRAIAAIEREAGK